MIQHEILTRNRGHMEPINEHTDTGPDEMKDVDFEENQCTIKPDLMKGNRSIDAELYRQVHGFSGATLSRLFEFDKQQYHEYFITYMQLLQYVCTKCLISKYGRDVTEDDVTPELVRDVGSTISAYAITTGAGMTREEFIKRLFPIGVVDKDVEQLIQDIDIVLSAMPPFPTLTPKS